MLFGRKQDGKKLNIEQNGNAGNLIGKKKKNIFYIAMVFSHK